MPIDDILFEGSNDFIMTIPEGVPGGDYLTVSYDGENVTTQPPATVTTASNDYAFIS